MVTHIYFRNSLSLLIAASIRRAASPAPPRLCHTRSPTGELSLLDIRTQLTREQQEDQQKLWSRSTDSDCGAIVLLLGGHWTQR